MSGNCDVIALGGCVPGCGAVHQYIDPACYPKDRHPDGEGRLIVRVLDRPGLTPGAEAWDRCPTCLQSIPLDPSGEEAVTHVDMIVAGEAHPMTVRPVETLRQLRDRALRETEHDHGPYVADRWELRDQAGELLDLDHLAVTLPEFRARLCLTLRTGAGS